MTVTVTVTSEHAADVDTKWGKIHIHEGVDRIIVDIWAHGYDEEPIWSGGWHEEALDPECRRECKPFQPRLRTTSLFWDCECDGDPLDYIHKSSDNGCDKCNMVRDECPDSRITEVASALRLDATDIRNLSLYEQLGDMRKARSGMDDLDRHYIAKRVWYVYDRAVRERR